MKYASWNVNGLRACVGKGFMDYFTASDVDALCLQETKLQPGQIQLDTPGYTQIWHSADKKGYSGTAIFTRREPLDVRYGMGLDEHDHEGRLICAEFDTHFLVCVYTPNSQRGLTRLDYRMKWEEDFLAYLKRLDEKKPVLVCGDMNVAHREIDLKNPKTNRKNAGFTDEERQKFSDLLAGGFTDSFRYFYPEKTGAYSWWSYRYNARANNAGWRIDYFLVSNRMAGRMQDAMIYADVLGSDHCPVGLLLR